MRSAARGAAVAFARSYAVILVLALWEGLTRSGLVNPRLFPSLEAIGQQFLVLLASERLAMHVGASLTRVVAGFTLATIVGLLLGVLMSRVAVFGRIFEPLFSLGYPVPRVALYPIFVFVFGLGHLSKVALVTLECLYPIAIHTYYGMRDVNPVYVWSAQNMGATRGQVFLRVITPAAAPHIFSGFRIALPVAFVITVLTEMVSSTEGLGWLITYASASLSRAQVFAGLGVVAVVGFVLDRLLAALRNRLIFWEKEAALVAIR